MGRGASNDAVNPTFYTIESPDITLTNPTKTGYTFAGWTGTELTAASTDVTIPTGSSGNKSYTANWTINQYTLTFDTAGGSAIDAITQDYSSDITATATPTKTGYTFASWDKTIPTKMPAENMTFTASWTANTYTVAFNANNGTGTMSAQSFTYDEAAKALTTNTFTRTGYTFNGWNTASNGSGTSYTGGQSVQNLTSTANATITLYVQWTIPNYTISYTLNGGTVATANPSSYNVESNAITLNNPTRTGYTFTGWTGSNGTTPTTTITIAKGSTGNRSYTATYTKINEQEPTPSAITLTKLNANLSADKDSLTLDAGSEDKIVFADKSTKILASNDYEISWDISPDITGIKISDGVLTVSKDSEVGSHDLTITATVGSGDIMTYADKLITIIINQNTIPETNPDISPVEMPSQTIINMDTQELEKTLSGGKALALTENTTTEELNKVLEKFSSLTTSVSLDLSKVEGIEEVKIDSAISLDSSIIAGNQSIKTVEVTGNTAIKTLNVTGSKVETLDAKGCEALEEVNVEGCASLVSLDVSETSITSLNAKDCKNLSTLDCSSCDISELNLDGCESLNELECRNQHIYGWPRSITISLLDLFEGSISSSALDDESKSL